MAYGRYRRDPTRPVYVISVAASMVEVHPRTLRIYEDEGLVCPARTPTNIRLYSENDIRRVLWIRHLTQDRGVNLAGVRILFELEERLGTRILEVLYDEGRRDRQDPTDGEAQHDATQPASRRAEPDGDSVEQAHNQSTFVTGIAVRPSGLAEHSGDGAKSRTGEFDA